jgi:glyoxylase-like metal-dependent hydrolase (beta-lactamase superfamily II)
MHEPARITAQLWSFQSRLFHTNAGIWLGDGEACLIDPGIFPDEIERIARFVHDQGARPAALILTHSHWDHVLGPERFPGVPTIAQAEYLTIVGQFGASIRREIADWEEHFDQRREVSFALPVPTAVVDEALRLPVGGLSLRLHHAPGHAADQLVVHHPESATLWAADMLSDLEIPFISHSLAAYERTLAELAAWELHVLVPGHGQATTDDVEIRRRLADDRAYLAELGERVERAVSAGLAIDETVAHCGDMRFGHPEENAEPHRLNVEAAYAELGGDADPLAVGWYRAWAGGDAGGTLENTDDLR